MIRSIEKCLITMACASVGLLWAAADVRAADWSGEYESPWNVSLSLKASGQSAYTGTLTVDGQSFPVTAAVSGQGLEGSFQSGSDRFPLSISTGEEPSQIVLQSEGSMYELSKKQVAQSANPLSRPSSNPLASSPAPATAAASTFRHPSGYFSLQLPGGWQAHLLDEDVLQLDTGIAGELVILMMAELEPHEIGKSSGELMPVAHGVMDEVLPQADGTYPSRQLDVRNMRVGDLQGTVSTRQATRQGESLKVWHGLVTSGSTAYMLVAPVTAPRENQVFADLDAAFGSLQIYKDAYAGGYGAAAPGNFGSVAAADQSRRVIVNGNRLTAQELNRLEGGAPVIPDGEYWYDNRSGMAGTVGGPTEAYLAPGLNLGGSLDPNASGGGTNVAFNGRYLHPIDLAGLEMYFGAINPGRYWIDGQGNYGFENQGKMGNLVEEIAMAQAVAAQYQAMYQQQLNQLVQQYYGQGQGGGGYYGQGGGYYNQGGGSVYSHFPNLGASGTGVSVGNVGGGDTIVNAGGVLWWPGK